ncbi:MAG: DUF1549 domain-containing protein [Verrucomicrobiales bacterium]
MALTPVDEFLASQNAAFVPRGEAPKGLLLRRVYLDLIGLPPTSEQLHAFLEDSRPDAFERVVDQLLASPRYGERWGRHFMDIWRYSDWYGRRQVPDVWNSAPQVWRWRDWIIRSFNADKGYDRMIKEMLAGDEIAPGDDDAAVATGFLVRNWYALNPNQWMRDNVEHVGKAFLGLTFNCAHCHDHKFDPITQRDYFAFRAFFEPLGVRQDGVRGEADPGPFQKYNYSDVRKVVLNGRVSVFDENPAAPTVMYRGGDERNVAPGKPTVAPSPPAFLSQEWSGISEVSLPVAAWYPGIEAWKRDDLLSQRRAEANAARAAFEAARKKAVVPQVGSLRQRLEDVAALMLEMRLRKAEAAFCSLEARIAADRDKWENRSATAEASAKAAGRAEREAVLASSRAALAQAELQLALMRIERGVTTALKQKDPVDATKEKALAESLPALRQAASPAEATLAAEKADYTPLTPLYPRTSTGRRKALAEWIASSDNPLTARVLVNHVWLRHFQSALVNTVADFGKNGAGPTNPGLLDWLSIEFMDAGWSIKRLHRLIITSSAYRAKSEISGAQLEAEAVRDSLLALGNGLDGAMGGVPIANSEWEKSRRRSVYFECHPEAGGHNEFAELFDPPNACDAYRRSRTVLPQQALALTNSELSLNESAALAKRIGAEASDDTAFVKAAFESVLCRQPTESEIKLCLEFLGNEPRSSLVHSMFSHNDFVTAR